MEGGQGGLLVLGDGKGWSFLLGVTSVGFCLFVFLRSSDFIRYPEAGPRESLGWPPNSPPQKRQWGEEQPAEGGGAPSGGPKTSPAGPSPLPLGSGSSGIITSHGEDLLGRHERLHGRF